MQKLFLEFCLNYHSYGDARSEINHCFHPFQSTTSSTICLAVILAEMSPLLFFSFSIQIYCSSSVLNKTIRFSDGQQFFLLFIIKNMYLLFLLTEAHVINWYKRVTSVQVAGLFDTFKCEKWPRKQLGSQ